MRKQPADAAKTAVTNSAFPPATPAASVWAGRSLSHNDNCQTGTPGAELNILHAGHKGKRQGVSSAKTDSYN